MILRLLADENVPASLIRRLRDIQGVEVSSIAEDAPGIDDTAVLQRAVQAGAVLLTSDHDFGQLVIAHDAASAGVILLRIHPVRAHLNKIVAVIEQHTEELPGHFVVISASRVRLRPLPT